MIKQSDITRFWNKINIVYDKSGDLNINECWEWRAGFFDVYPAFWFNGKTITAHRFSYMLYYQEDITNLFVCHNCDNVKCVKPHHLFLGTPQDNSNDMILKNRSCRGEKNYTSILTEQDVTQILIDIYNDKYQTVDEINKRYNTSSNTIREILDGRTWKNVTDKLKIPLLNIKEKIIRDMSKGNASKLNELQVRDIKLKLKSGFSQAQLCREYGVQQGTISNIKNNKSWKWVQV